MNIIDTKINQDTKNRINDITNSLKSIDPNKIILFGSVAKQNESNDSDLDIMVVTNSDFFPSNYSEKMDVFLTVAKTIREHRKKFPVDLIVYTKPMYKEFMNSNSLMAREILNHGIVLYEKNN